MNKGITAKSKSERVAQIRDNRAAERAAMRNSENAAVNLGSETGSSTPVLPHKNSDEELTPILRMIKADVEERLKND